jgi:hypothetical protein
VKADGDRAELRLENSRAGAAEMGETLGRDEYFLGAAVLWAAAGWPLDGGTLR